MRYTPSERQLENLENNFKSHPPHGDQVERYERIREAAKALWLETLTPETPEQTLAMRALEQYVFWSIARNEKPQTDSTDTTGGPYTSKT